MFTKITEPESKILIAVDPGKHTLKAVAKDNRISFRTKIQRNDMELDAIGNSFKVEYNGLKNIIGEQAEELSFDVSKTNIVHKLATYIAITQLMGNANIIQLVLNCPVSIYKNKILRDEYKEFILDNRKVKLSVNNRDYAFTFENVLILPEDYGVVYKYPQYFKNKRVALIGLGGLNMNFMIIDNLAPEVSTMFTVNHGSNELETNIINELNSKFGQNFDHKNAPYIIKEGGFKDQGVINKESIKIVDRIIGDFINDKVIQETKKNGHNINNLDVMFVGGTSLSIEYKLSDYLRHALVVDDAQWVGVEGSRILGEIKYAEAK